MYLDFFGLKESPFSIAPNPEFLYMSDSHREGMAHLLYGLGDTGGFVLLTGEVGTGKTTLSRSLLRQTSDVTSVAFILNPALTPVELLACVCDQLQIEYEDQSCSLKSLSDSIHRYLLANHEQGRNTLLMIDEAQHLSVDALEQLRLLTNLETDTRKLLRIVLIGQPELQQMLKQPLLRQLAQRITARYHLLPLTLPQTQGYILHRLNQAGCERPLFSIRQIRLIHRVCGGIPRLVNLLCDRALLAAYGSNQMVVDSPSLKRALNETDLKPYTRGGVSGILLGVNAGLFILLLVFGGLYYFGWPEFRSFSELDAIKEPVVVKQTSDASVVDNELNPEPVMAWQQAWLELRSHTSSLEPTMQLLYRLWGYEVPLPQSSCQLAEAVGLACLPFEGSVEHMLELNYPAQVKLNEEGEDFYALVRYIDEDITLWLAGKQIHVSREWFEQRWDGHFNIFWQPPEGFSQPLRPGDSGSAILWLEERISLLQGTPVRYINQFDGVLAAKVRLFQSNQGLKVDGVAGTFTLLRLAQLVYLDQPRLGEL